MNRFPEVSSAHWLHMGMSWDLEMRCVKVCQSPFGSCQRSMQTVTNKTYAVRVL